MCAVPGRQRLLFWRHLPFLHPVVDSDPPVAQGFVVQVLRHFGQVEAALRCVLVVAFDAVGLEQREQNFEIRRFCGGGGATFFRQRRKCQAKAE